MALAPGTRLGPYEILSALGAGGMGEVWKARDTRLNRLVAIKASLSPFSERFEREARAIAAVNHHHVCSLYDVGPDYLVMEYVEGEWLHGPVPPAQALEVAEQILDALDAAHQRGIVHRDLKPGNILLTKSGVKVLDFGLAKIKRAPDSPSLMETEAASLTAEGSILGTLPYMSPEQVEGRDADARSDIFAFGVVLYELIAARDLSPARRKPTSWRRSSKKSRDLCSRCSRERRAASPKWCAPASRRILRNAGNQRAT